MYDLRPLSIFSLNKDARSNSIHFFGSVVREVGLACALSTFPSMTKRSVTGTPARIYLETDRER